MIMNGKNYSEKIKLLEKLKKALNKIRINATM